MKLTVDEIVLISFVLGALLLGATVKHFRDGYRAAHPSEFRESGGKVGE